jgi:hypothetical protein
MKSPLTAIALLILCSFWTYAGAVDNAQRGERPLPPSNQLRTQSTPKNLREALKHRYIAAYTAIRSVPDAVYAPPMTYGIGEFTPTSFVQDLRANTSLAGVSFDKDKNKYYYVEADFSNPDGSILPPVSFSSYPQPPALFAIDLASGQTQRLAKCPKPWNRLANVAFDGHKIYGIGQAFSREDKELFYSLDLKTKNWQLLHEKKMEDWMWCPIVTCADDKIVALYTFRSKDQPRPTREHPRTFPVHTYRLDSYSKSGRLFQSKAITKDGKPLVENGEGPLISLGGNYLVLHIAPPMAWDGEGHRWLDPRKYPLYKATNEKVRLRTYVIDLQTAQVLATNQIEMPYYTYADTGQEYKP